MGSIEEFFYRVPDGLSKAPFQVLASPGVAGAMLDVSGYAARAVIVKQATGSDTRCYKYFSSYKDPHMSPRIKVDLE